MAEYYLKATYAVTGRAQCRGCWNKIDKNVLRIAYVIDVENYHNEKWFHVNCFKYLPAKVNKANVEDIEGYDNLTPSDQQILDIKMYELKHMPSEQYQAETKKQAARVKNMRREFMQNDYTHRGQVMRGNYKHPCLYNGTQEDIIEISDDNFEQHERQLNKKLNTKNKHSDYYYKVNKEEQEQEQQKTDVSQQMLKTETMKEQDQVESKQVDSQKSDSEFESKPIGYTEAEWKIYSKAFQECLNKTGLVLKELLRYNDQKQSGEKPELMERVADCMTLGAIPKCPRCKGGKPQYRKESGTYKCPGFVDESDYVECGKRFLKNEIERIRWNSF